MRIKHAFLNIMDQKSKYKKKIIIVLILYILLEGAIVMASVIPSQVKDIVTFIFIKNDKGEIIPNGTGFFIGVKNEGNEKIFNVYLVTAKHVLQDSDKKFYSSVYIRLNTKNGQSQLIELPLQKKDQRIVFTHQESEVDIAVIPCLPSDKMYDFKFLPNDLITTKELFEKNKIQEGDEVFFTGLFTPYFGHTKSYPIVRFGRVSLLTDEKIKWENDLVDLYLVETQSFGGNSGSPVFFYLTADRTPGTITIGPPKLLLAGIMKGCFLDAKEVKIAETKSIPISVENVGIAAVVPAYKLSEILFSKELSALRKQPAVEKAIPK